MPRPSPSPSSAGPTPAPPTLAQLAEVLHASSADALDPLLVTVGLADGSVALGTWPIPPEVEHPAEVLLGFVAPPAWDAIGLVTRGLLHPLDRAAGSPAPGTAIRATVLLDRTGGGASILERADGAPEVLLGAPEGWVADALRRCLRLPTPPPDPPSAAVEAVWLDRLAGLVLAHPGRRRRWADLAVLHPLAPPGPALPGELLALQCTALDLETDWSRLRRRWRSPGAVPAARVVPPGGTTVGLDQWFDDGSLSRWLQRFHVPAPDLLPAVLDALPTELADELVDALVSVGRG